MGLVQRSIEWLNVGWVPGGVMKYQSNHKDLNTRAGWEDTPWWKEFVTRVKHIHLYNQLVVYELGYVEQPYDVKSIGLSIPVKESGEHKKVKWGPVLEKVKTYTSSPW